MSWLHHAWMETRSEVVTAAVIGIIVSQVAIGFYVLGGQPAGNLPGTTQHITQELATTPPLATAYDICLDPDSEFAHYTVDDHYEGQLSENTGQLNAVRYHLFFRMNPELDVVIEEARAGQITTLRTDPNTDAFRSCVAHKKVTEVRPTQ